MLSLKNILQETKTRYLQSIAGNRLNIELDRPIISFTFDDVPRSALLNGVPILNQYDLKGTFYVASGIEKSNECSEEYLSTDDIKELHRTGHEIGCHTYSHFRLAHGTAKDLAKDAKKNKTSLQNILNTSAINHFSYPFGQVNFNAKKLLAQEYKTMRSSRPGINVYKSDLYLLRATNIYSPSFNKQSIKSTIERVNKLHGWLIFYTHGVEATPDPYGCTMTELEWVVKQSIDSGAQIMPVGEAYERIVQKL